MAGRNRMATVKHVLSGKVVASKTATSAGLVFERFFTDGKVSPFDKVEWEKRTALIGNEKGVAIFKQENVVASKYFHGKHGTSERETSVRQLIGRVVNTIVRWGQEGGYFADNASEDAFRD